MRLTWDFPVIKKKKKKTTCNAEDTGDTAGLIPWRVRKIPWRRAWQPTPVFLLGESHGQRSLAGYRPQGCTELDTAEVTEHTHLRLTRGWVRNATPDTRGWVRNATPENLVCSSLMIKGKAGRGRRPLSFLSRHESCFLHPLLLQGSFLVPIWSS